MQTPDVDRWFGTGSSAHPDPTEAGREAATAALLGDDPALVIVFASIAYDLQRLVNAIAACAPGVPMVGCTTAGEISTGAARDRSVAVSVLGGEFSVATACATEASTDLAGSGAAAAGAVAALPSPELDHQVLLLLTDGLAGNQQDVVRGAYGEVGAAVPLVGGCAGDDGAMAETRQIHNGRVHTDAVIGAAIASRSPIGIGVRHGWRPVGEPMLVSSSDDGGVQQLDGDPALDRYLDRLGLPRSLADRPEELGAVTMTHPLGLKRRSGEEVRFINGFDPEQGTLTSIAEIPQGSLVWVMEGDQDSVLAGTADSCQQALASLGSADPIGLVLFDCIARRTVLGPSGVASEMATVASVVPDVPAIGFYTYGEIARTQGVRGFHNQTLVTLALS